MSTILPQRSPRTQRGPGDPLTEAIIACAIEVHRILGPGLLESIYEEALCHEFTLQGIPYERQKEVAVVYKNRTIKGQRIDLLVDGQVVIEIKAVQTLNDAFTAQALSYLKHRAEKSAIDQLRSNEARIGDQTNFSVTSFSSVAKVLHLI